MRAGERAATLTEYALIVGLVVVVTIGAVSRLQSDGKSNLTADGGRIGASTDNAYYAGAASTTTAPPGTTTTVVAVTAVGPGSLTAAPPPSNDGNKWIANATVTIVDRVTGDPISGVLVSGTWDPPNPAVSGSCTTTAPTGSCSLQRTDIPDSKLDTTFTITSITGAGYVWIPLPGDPTTVTVSCGLNC